jgi:hypothetical protein
MLQRGRELQRNQFIPEQEIDQRAAAELVAAMSTTERQESLTSAHERLGAMESRFQSSDASYARQIDEMAKDLASVKAAIAALEDRGNALESAIVADRARAVVSRAREVAAVEYDIAILSAEEKRLMEAAQVRSPFVGRVVYRHPAPGLAMENAPILAVSPGPGFKAKIGLPRDEVDELSARKEPVQLAVENPVLNHFFTVASSAPAPSLSKTVV